MRNLSLAGILVTALMIAGCENSNTSSFGLIASANASAPQFLQAGKTYYFGGPNERLTIIEIDKESGWVKAVKPDSTEWRWINLAQVSMIGEI